MKAAVLGSPIGHSLSPVLHGAAYQALGLDDWSYAAIECDEAALPELISSLGPDWAGLSLTMPLKRTVLPLLDRVEPLAVATGGANTVVFRPDGRYGYNTDVQGIVDALAEAGVPAGGSVTILGAGATACSALAALPELGAAGADIVVRDPSRAAIALAAAQRLRLPVRLCSFADLTDPATSVPDLLISTVPAGAADAYANSIGASGRVPAAVLDVVYSPWPTQLATAASAAGAIVVSGFGMLLHQAAAQVELMTGKPAPLAAMRTAGEAELSRRSALPRSARSPHRVRDLGVAAVAQPVDHALDVGGRPVLAQLGLGLDPGDQQLDPHDGPELTGDELRRRVVHRPGTCAGRLVLAGEAAHQILGPAGVVVHYETAVHVRGHVVPRRHDPAVLGLGRVPGRRDVRIRPADDRHRLPLCRKLPLRVVPRQVAVQRAMIADPRHIHERQHRRHQPVRRHRHQICRAVVTQQLADRRLIGREMGWNVHIVTSPCQVNRAPGRPSPGTAPDKPPKYDCSPGRTG
jgi:shikimate dehydrogenase